MLCIAICDDHMEELQALSSLLNKYKTERSIPIRVCSFQNGFSLLDAIAQGEHFDITLLDIIMPGENGIDIARIIRKNNTPMEIIFLTSSPEYAVSSYTVKAQNYLLKPISKDTLFLALDDCLASVKQHEDNGFIIHSGPNQYTRILFSRFVYGEAMGKSVVLHLSDQSTVSFVMTFTELLLLLNGQPGLIQPHRSYVVNMQFMEHVSKTEICLMGGAKIPLSRKNYNEVSKQFMNFAFSREFEKGG
ncbi:MAG: LytTR family DNA-binding domain-containing protein [Lachnospiraceae bacterium]|nr:LytTR family DNA-binding domain-containing protein [Lachnospiraceae bacterium]